MDNKELEKKYKPMQANVTVDLKLLFREQVKKDVDNRQNTERRGQGESSRQ